MCHTCAGLEEGEEGENYAMVLEASRVGNLKTILALAEKLPDYIVYNAARSSLQIRSCDKLGIIASLRLTSPELKRLAMKLQKSPMPSTPVTIGSQE